MKSLLFAIFLGALVSEAAICGDKLDDLVAQCRVTHFCNAMAGIPVNTSGKALAKANECFRDKVKSCFYATILAGAKEGKRSDMLDRSILYGNFCGWRSLAKHADGKSPDWGNLEDVVEAIQRTPAIDVIDEACKQHDLDYDQAPFDVCKADDVLIDRLQKISWNSNVELSREAREVALAFSETIRWNRFSCGVIGEVQKAKRH